MNLYRQMGEQLRALFDDLFDPRLEGRIRQKVKQILVTASQIGGTIKQQAEQLYSDVDNFLQRPGVEKLVARMKQHALKLEQETREL